MTLPKTSPAGLPDLPQNLTLVPSGVKSRQEPFGLDLFGSDEVLFGDFEGDALYTHMFEDSIFAGTAVSCFLPSTALTDSASPMHQLQPRCYEHQQKELHLQRRFSQQYQHQQHQQMPYTGSIHDLIEIKPVRMEMLRQRTPVFERLSSPDGSLSPTSDQDYFGSMTDDEPSSSSSYSSYTSLSSLADEHIASPLSQLTMACDPVVIGDLAPSPLHRIRRVVPQLDYTQMTVDSSLASSSPTFSPTASTASALSSPLKQHFSSFSDSEGPEEDESQLHGKRRKRVRRPYVKKPTQPKPSIKIPCTFPGCPTECSSQPSLARHAETHKWRGLYAPVRCEACQSALSNEFSVQRHILRAPATSACRKMRVYSVMRSETQVECTVRFYPKRPHGKKTVVVDLEAFRRRSLRN
ncbi:hypothetical protein BG003_006339 [Podila horticola]|nr:hypothetical protein BG003_006339 [Podila horticola]